MNSDFSWSVAVAFDGDAKDVAGKRIVSHAFGPLDYEDGFFVTQELVEVDGVGGAGAFVQTVEIDVIELQTSRVRIYQRE